MNDLIKKMKEIKSNKKNNIEEYVSIETNTEIFLQDFEKLVKKGNLVTIKKLVKFMSNTIQGQLLSRCYYNDRNYHLIARLVLRSILIDLPHIEKEYNQKIDIQTTPVISSVWEHSRLVDALITQNQYVGNPFDERQHSDSIISYMIQPLGIVIVSSGNHSINSAIVHGEGELTVNKVVDITSLFEKYRFTGKEYVDIKTNQKIDFAPLINHSEPLLYELGLMFEMARILEKNNIILNYQ